MPLLLMLLLLQNLPSTVLKPGHGGPPLPPGSPRIYRGPSFYPKLPEPHLQSVNTNITFSYKEKLNGNKVRVEQKRPKDGWCGPGNGDCGGYQYLDANGKLVSPIQLDLTWRNPTVILIALLDNFDREIAVTEIQADSKKLLAGETLVEKAAFR